MASRANKKRAQQAAASAPPGAAARDQAVLAAIQPVGSGSLMDRRSDAFRRENAARKIALDLIDRDEALNKRAAELYTEGMNKGFKEASWRTLRCCMAGACLMMQDAFGLPDDEIVRGLKIMYDKTAWALEYSDMVDEVLEKTGILLQLDDPLEPIQQIREKEATG